MKIGKSKKNSASALPSEIPQKPKKREPVAAVVAKARKLIARSDPAPRPSTKTTKPKAKSKSAVPTLVKRVRAPKIKIVEAPPAQPPTPATRAPAPALTAFAPAQPSVPGPVVTKTRPSRQPRPVPVEIPAILLEPDHVPTEPAIAGPGARFALTPTSERAVAQAPAELPEAYGTEQIFLAARDPYCLFASWDLDAKQRARYNAASTSGALTIRLRRGYIDGPIELEVHTPANSRDRFIDVMHPNTTFVAELGFHEKNSGLWRRISVSKPVTMPRDRVATMPPAKTVVAPAVEPSVQAPMAPPPPPAPQATFAIQPPPIEQPRWSAKQEPEPLRDRPEWTQPKEKPRWSAPKPVPAPKWSPSKTKALDDLISLEFRRMQQGSLEIEELLRRRTTRTSEEQEKAAPSSLELLELPELLAGALGLARPEQAPSSLEVAGQPSAQKGFWLKVNAELIIYGSTEPNANVSIGGRPIRLRPDGTFSYRFALPDGAYELPVVAIAQDAHDGRAAELRFSRATLYSGEVGAHPQDHALKTPAPENL